MPKNGSYDDPQIDALFRMDPYQGRSLPTGTQYRGIPGLKTGPGAGSKRPAPNGKMTGGKAPSKEDSRYND